MLPFSVSEPESFQDTQESAMHDTCHILTATATVASRYGKKVVSYAPGLPSPCGFQQGAGTNEVLDGANVVLVDAILRLPINTRITSIDRVRVTYRYGVAISPETYSVIGQPARGPSALVVKLERVTDGSDQ